MNMGAWERVSMEVTADLVDRLSTIELANSLMETTTPTNGPIKPI